MILSGCLSTMNIWVDKLDDISFSINDVYMVLLMTGWMFFFMGIVYSDRNIFLLGFLLTLFSIVCIRTQFLVSTYQYGKGMIPHHSMAIHMSKKLLESNDINPEAKKLAQSIIVNQREEINILKKFL